MEMHRQARIARFQRRHGDAIQLDNRALDVIKHDPDRALESTILLHRAQTKLEVYADAHLALTDFDAAVVIIESLDDPLSLALAYGHRSAALWKLFNPRESLTDLDKALALNVGEELKARLSGSRQRLLWDIFRSGISIRAFSAPLPPQIISIL